MTTLELGLVARPHGVRGELKLKLHYAQSTTLFDVREVLLVRGDENHPYRIVAARRTGKGLVLRLEGVETRGAAETLRGCHVLVDRGLLPPLSSDEYYLADLVGCTVAGPAGEIGVVEEIQAHPTLDALAIVTAKGKRLLQPLDDAWLESVSVRDKLIVLNSEDGLID